MNLRSVRNHIINPKLIARQINKFYFMVINRRDFNERGINIFERDWDNLIILDACRYDLFRDEYNGPGELNKVSSRGSHTAEFLRGNFKNRDLSNVVYITASPMLQRHLGKVDPALHDLVNVWDEDGWDSDTRTVLPETMYEQARIASEKYPNKRLVIHFLQPHYPFLSSDRDFDKGHVDEENPDQSLFWDDLLLGKLDINKEQIWEYYRKNLQCALPDVKKICEAIEGKTVITSDHGNMIGEKAFPIPISEWGHPEGTHLQQLIEVPWVEYPFSERKKITEGKKHDLSKGRNIKEKLRALGYKE